MTFTKNTATEMKIGNIPVITAVQYPHAEIRHAHISPSVILYKKVHLQDHLPVGSMIFAPSTIA